MVFLAGVGMRVAELRMGRRLLRFQLGLMFSLNDMLSTWFTKGANASLSRLLVCLTSRHLYADCDQGRHPEDDVPFARVGFPAIAGSVWTDGSWMSVDVVAGPCTSQRCDEGRLSRRRMP